MIEQEPVNSAEVQSKEAKASQLKACTFKVGSHTFSIALEYVKEITEASEIFPLPLTPPYVEGIVHLRGSAIPVISIGKIKNINDDQTKAKQLIVLDLGSDKLGIAVSEIPDLSTEFLGELIDVHKIYETYRITQC
jgi:purine-binding chemotaxis protein CheW